MNYTSWLLCTALFFNTGIFADCFQILRGKSFLQPRSVGTDAARELVGLKQYINRYIPDGRLYGVIDVTPGYEQSFRPNRIAEYFFGCDTITISGSQVATRDTNQILADYFGLSPTFLSNIHLKPKLKNTFVDFDVYLGWECFYLRIHAPVNSAQSHIKIEEFVNNDGSDTPFPPLYMDVGAVTEPVKSFSEAIRGGFTFGDMTEPLNFGKISACSISKTTVADVHIALGWNFINREIGHAGFDFLLVVPTGNRPTGEFLFEPIVGNGHHWEAGLGFTGHLIVWEYGAERSIAIYTIFNMTHLFNARQKRSFDLCENGFASRYILTKEFDENHNYNGTIIPLINRTTLDCKVKTGFQLDFVVMAGYTGSCFDWDLGYNGWMRTKESICITGGIPANMLGLKGLQNVNTTAGVSNATQSRATINGNNICDPQAGLLINQAFLADIDSPVFITQQEINRKSAANPRTFTHKIFGGIDYHHDVCWAWWRTYFIGIGASAEFESLNPRLVIKANKNSISQWSMWLKTGLAF